MMKIKRNYTASTILFSLGVLLGIGVILWFIDPWNPAWIKEIARHKRWGYFYAEVGVVVFVFAICLFAGIYEFCERLATGKEVILDSLQDIWDDKWYAKIISIVISLPVVAFMTFIFFCIMCIPLMFFWPLIGVSQINDIYDGIK
jgi:hypothetical protein